MKSIVIFDLKIEIRKMLQYLCFIAQLLKTERNCQNSFDILELSTVSFHLNRQHQQKAAGHSIDSIFKQDC